MSRQIEAGKPLTAEQRAYLLVRGEDIRVAAHDAAYGVLDEDTEEVLPYEQWSAGDLRAEIDDRNEDRETKISKAGGIAEMAARLYEDDAARTA